MDFIVETGDQKEIKFLIASVCRIFIEVCH